MNSRCLCPAVVISLCVLLSACFYGPCKQPARLEQGDLYGEWQLTYPTNHWVSDPVEGSLVVTGTVTYLVAPEATPMSLAECSWVEFRPDLAWEGCGLLRREAYPMEGQESITLYDDGTYQQVFVSGAFSYTSPTNKWELILDSPDGPKLQMYDMKYFAEGVAQANSYVPITLHPQVVDRLRVQDYRETQGWDEGLIWDVQVVYPERGYIFLYSRRCAGELSLVQMVFRPSDPDNLVIENPVFQHK